jgi:hypothetical protein
MEDFNMKMNDHSMQRKIIFVIEVHEEHIP